MPGAFSSGFSDGFGDVAKVDVSPCAAQCYEMPIGEDTDNVIIGNKDVGAQWEACVDVPRWNGEESIKFRYADITGTPDVQYGRVKKRVMIGSDDVEARIYAKSADSVEFELILHNQPASNVFTWEVSGHDNVDFLYQPALTQQEIEEGHVRPPDIVGSYAAYAATPKANVVTGPKYRAGKLFHIRRPYATDSLNRICWATLLFVGNEMRVTLDADWLADANYPVTLDPNLGYDSAGASTFQGQRIYVTGYNTTATSDGTASNLYVYTPSGSTGNCKMAVYNAGFGGNRLTSSYEFVSPTANQWNAQDCSGDALSISNGVDYYAAYAMDTGGHTAAYDSGVTNDTLGLKSGGFTYASEMAHPCTATTWNGAFRWSFYLEYTESGGGNAMPMAVHHYKMAGGL